MATIKIPSRPQRQVCPLCATDELETRPLADGIWEMSCPTCDYVWQCDIASEIQIRDSLMGQIGLFEDLPRCLVEGEPYVEHGMVEDRYRRLNPKAYKELVDRYSHTRIAATKYSASSFIASALGHLARRDEVVYVGGEPTGYWSYNSRIGYWALPPGPQPARLMTWAEYAPTVGLDPTGWVLGP